MFRPRIKWINLKGDGRGVPTISERNCWKSFWSSSCVGCQEVERRTGRCFVSDSPLPVDIHQIRQLDNGERGVNYMFSETCFPFWMYFWEGMRKVSIPVGKAWRHIAVGSIVAKSGGVKVGAFRLRESVGEANHLIAFEECGVLEDVKGQRDELRLWWLFAMPNVVGAGVGSAKVLPVAVGMIPKLGEVFPIG